MLLVALVALSTATFAWFTTSTQATADKLSVKTVKSSEIKLSSKNISWTDQLHYGLMGKVLKPASSADGINWFTATAAGKSASTAKTDTIAPLTNLDGYVIAEELNVQNAGKAEVENVTISWTLSETEATSGAGYVRMALVPVESKGADPTAANFKAGVYAAGTDTAEAYTYDESNAIKTATVAAADGTNGSITIDKLTAVGTEGATKYFNLYVWFEGQDTDCYDVNAGNEMPEITFTVTGKTIETTD
jgi:hypothetical protein